MEQAIKMYNREANRGGRECSAGKGNGKGRFRVGVEELNMSPAGGALVVRRIPKYGIRILTNL
jgi:hypothetical protein